MLITDLSEKEIADFMTRARLARLACAQNGQPYIVPIFCAYQNGCLYCASTEGKKIDWMRANPLVCVELEEVHSPQHWTSVVIDGRFEEIPHTPEWEPEREFAWSILQQRSIWWEPAYVETIVNRTEKALHPLYFRIHIRHIAGRRACEE
jgi:uncharacterized protein